MKLKSIKNHLKPYSIHGKRKTTINHAFASAIAPVSAYNDEHVASAMIFLGQDPHELRCVYCNDEAETWDHLVGLVEEGCFKGYGHQIGNLVPCCRRCNSKKGNNKFEYFIASSERISGDRQKLLELLNNYQEEYTAPLDIEKSEREFRSEWNIYREIKTKIINLMKEADEIAVKIRPPAIPYTVSGKCDDTTHRPKLLPSTISQGPNKETVARKNILYSFLPQNIEQFKEELIRAKHAHIRIHFSNGRNEIKPWDASKFKETSDLMHNINSKTWFRRDYVERFGVIGADFSIAPFEST